MDLIKQAMADPFNNILGLFIYFIAVVGVTVLTLTLLLHVIPNPLSRRLRSAIIGTLTMIVIAIWFLTIK
ncbi:hypothetical protein GCM10012290_22430 [Halolactibacillus alkaliphilus]|uniref:Uncharacterized protein n=1 Tax=Halolactibacillus alkaliphilus TaxID=442899 RepID=A0A511X3Y3_9BACI|nr:hypothetical protein [Halolactibacillus alkaliphilus]GEN57643.1 hypothetical protein HAL01_21070 [Halolactibacillus alkaliphilus]GGN74500.1 hypothetical protein GCM10012290_22430 [Halolactibacillus alkaliphilus]SFP02016.1 hypothetical protein SAMN05720591_13311 [Halolactibacillus alkaliphilus]